MADFSFIDLFAGIGGIRIAFERAGGSCVFTSEIDKFARETYHAYFEDSEDHVFNHDLTAINPLDIPDHDVLTGGFPCQPFSLAGVSKKNSLGREHGFRDLTKGTLFFDIKEILLAKRPRAFLLENVKNLRSHDGGKTWQIIRQTLHECGYVFTDKIIDAATVVPQHRERIFIVGFEREFFNLPTRMLDFSTFWGRVEAELDKRRGEQRELLKVGDNECFPKVGHILESHSEVPENYTLTPGLWEYLQEYRRKHRARGNGFGFSLVDGESDYTRTISARYYKDGSEALVNQGSGIRPRRLTPYECARLQGFPEDFQALFDRESGIEQPVSDTQAYKQFGNSVAVPVVSSIAAAMRPYLVGSLTLSNLPDTDLAMQQRLGFDSAEAVPLVEF